jgi:hypothetical protein
VLEHLLLFALEDVITLDNFSDPNMRFIAVLVPEGSSTNSTPVYSSLLNPAHN